MTDPVRLSVRTTPLALIIEPVFDPSVQREYERQAPEVIPLTPEQAVELAGALIAAAR